MARTGSPSPTAVSAKTSRLTPASTGSSARTRLAAGSARSVSIGGGRSAGALARACLGDRFFLHLRGPGHGPRTPPAAGIPPELLRTPSAADNRPRTTVGVTRSLQVDLAQGREELGGGGQRGALEPLHTRANQ